MKPEKSPKISIETQKRMHAFFMKTSAPRIYAKKLEEEKRELEALERLEDQTNKNE